LGKNTILVFKNLTFQIGKSKKYCYFKEKIKRVRIFGRTLLNRK